MDILQYTLLFSTPLKRGRTPFFAINSNQFDKRLEDYTKNELLKVGFLKDALHVAETQVPSLSRKIFRTYLDELLKEKLLIRIKTNDNRSKYYSITPLGIIHLIKSSQFFDRYKYPHPERSKVILILQTFAQQNVKPYHSIIFENQKFFNRKTKLLNDIGIWFGIGFRNQVPHVFSNVNIVQENIRSKYSINFFEFFISNGYGDSNKYRLAIFDFDDEKYVNIEELDKLLLNSFYHDNEKNEYAGLNLDDEQFYHYLANLMLCSLVYDSAVLDFDSTNLFNKALPKLKKIRPYLKKGESFREKYGNIPEYLLRILFLFLKHIARLSQSQYELTTGFGKELYSMQFNQTKVSNSQLMN